MSNKIILTSLIISLGLGLATITLAQEDIANEPVEEIMIEEVVEDETVEPEDLEIKEPKILPNSPFYFVKEWGRTLQSFFAFGQIKKSELEQKFANERLMELKKISEQGKNSEILKKATEKYEKSLEKIRSRTEKIKEKASKNPKVEKFLEKYTHQQILHHKLLEKLEKQVPPEAFEKIKEARERHLERFKDVMLKLEEKDKIPDRLDKVLEKQKGSDFKQLKHIEFLKRFREKMPDEVKEKIKEKEEKRLERLKNKLEKLPEERQKRFQKYIERMSGDKEKQLEILEELKVKIKAKSRLRKKIDDSQEKVEKKIRIKERIRKESKPEGCYAVYDPVCGKDGKTYSNDCYAKLYEMKIDYKGKCK